MHDLDDDEADVLLTAAVTLACICGALLLAGGGIGFALGWWVAS